MLQTFQKLPQNFWNKEEKRKGANSEKTKKALRTPRISKKSEESSKTRFSTPRILPTAGIDETESSRMENMAPRMNKITTIQDTKTGPDQQDRRNRPIWMK